MSHQRPGCRPLTRVTLHAHLNTKIHFTRVSYGLPSPGRAGRRGSGRPCFSSLQQQALWRGKTGSSRERSHRQSFCGRISRSWRYGALIFLRPSWSCTRSVLRSASLGRRRRPSEPPPPLWRLRTICEGVASRRWWRRQICRPLDDYPLFCQPLPRALDRRTV